MDGAARVQAGAAFSEPAKHQVAKRKGLSLPREKVCLYVLTPIPLAENSH